MEESILEITIEVYATEDLENGILVWETESIVLVNHSEYFPLTKTELDVLIDSINSGDINPLAADCWHSIILERQCTKNGYYEPQYEWYALRHMKTIGNNNEL